MAIVADYSAGKPGARALKANGFIGAVRYVGFSDPNDSRTPKCTTAQELADFTAEGIGMALVFESRADDWRGGYWAGYNNYLIARAHADRIGFPGHRPIYMAIDSEVIGDAAHWTVYEYLRGARDAAGGNHKLVGAYGQYSVMVYLWNAPDPVVHWYWQCRAWSGTPINYFAQRHLFQRVGTVFVFVGSIASDINDVAQDDWGQHNINVEELPLNIIGSDGKAYPAEQMFMWWDQMFNQMQADLARALSGIDSLTDDEAHIISAVLQGTREAIAEAPKPVAEVNLAALIAGLRTGLGSEIAKELGRRLSADNEGN